MNLDYLFWEVLPDNVFYINVSSPGKDCFQTIKFKRDDNYNLICELTGNKSKNSKHPWEIFDIGGKAGQLKMGMKSIFSAAITMGGWEIDVENLLLNNVSHNMLEDKGEIRGTGVADKITYRFTKMKESKNNDVESVTYWFLNKPRSGFPYTRITKFETGGKATRKIKNVYEENLEMTTISSFTSRDSMLLEFNGRHFIFGEVSDKRSKTKASYLKFQKNNIPGEKEILTITNFLTYLLGAELIPIGYIKFGKNLSILEQVYISSWKHDLEKILNNTVSINPIPLNWTFFKKIGGDDKFENIISKLLKEYNRRNEEFKLDLIIFYLRCSWGLNLDILAQPITTAIDLFQQAWFKSTSSISKGKYMKDNEYKNIINRYLLKLEEDLSKIESKCAIINRIQKANEFSLSERSKTFFKEIGLKTCEVENTIMNERNKIIHGSLKKKDYQKLMSIANGMYALLNRMILKILDYNSEYIDYSTYGFPARHIDFPLRGPQNNGIF